MAARPAKIEIGNNDYKVPRLLSNGMATHDKYEDWLNNVYKVALMSKQGIFIDVGANRGQTLIKILSLDPDREYLGFEPQHDCCHFISDFIKRNSLSKHTVLPVGLSNRFGVVQLFKRRDNADGAASTVVGFRPTDFYSTRERICIAKGDDVLNAMDHKQISIVKIDVEGGELEVIDGMREVLKAHRPFIFLEVLNHFLAVTRQELDEETIKFRNDRIQELENTLRRLGYKIFNILPNSGIAEVLKIEPQMSNDLKITNYVAIHRKQESIFRKNSSRMHVT